MTYYKCPNCAGEKSTEKHKVMVICPCCQIEMKPIGYPHQKITEVKNGYGSEFKTD